MSPKPNTETVTVHSAPLAVTLAGHESAQYGRPVVMIAMLPRVYVWEVEQQSVTTLSEASKQVQPLIEVVRPYALPSRTGTCYMMAAPYGFSLPAVQAACIVALTAAVSYDGAVPKSLPQMQSVCFRIERSFFGHSSHAQTATSLHGGLVYYRKEFEFHRTSFKLPMKLPDAFLTDLYLTEPKRERKKVQQTLNSTKAYEREKVVKKLVLSIYTEDAPAFNSALSQCMPSHDLTISSAEGISQGTKALPSHTGYERSRVNIDEMSLRTNDSVKTLIQFSK